jgi:hypothetical protein
VWNELFVVPLGGGGGGGAGGDEAAGGGGPAVEVASAVLEAEVGHWSNTGQTPVKCWSNAGRRTGWASAGAFLVDSYRRYLTSIDQ